MGRAESGLLEKLISSNSVCVCRMFAAEVASAAI